MDKMWIKTSAKEIINGQWAHKMLNITAMHHTQMWIKTTRIYHFMYEGGHYQKQTQNNNCWWGCGETGSLMHYWWECKMAQLLWKTLWQFLRKLKTEWPQDSAISFVGMYPKEMQAEQISVHWRAQQRCSRLSKCANNPDGHWLMKGQTVALIQRVLSSLKNE